MAIFFELKGVVAGLQAPAQRGILAVVFIGADPYCGLHGDQLHCKPLSGGGQSSLVYRATTAAQSLD